jgi:excisionase family DNA binding protein
MRPKARTTSLHGDRLLLRVSDVCLLLGVGRSTVYEMIARGELPVVRIGRLVRVSRPGLEDWIAANTSGSRHDNREAA